VWGGGEFPASTELGDAEMMWEDLEHNEMLAVVMRDLGQSELRVKLTFPL
jgi:hypothetical protein